MTRNTSASATSGGRGGTIARIFAILLAILFIGPLILGSSNASADTQTGGTQSSASSGTDAQEQLTGNFTQVPVNMPSSTSVFTYSPTPSMTQLGTGSVNLGSVTTQVFSPNGAGGKGGSGGGNGGKGGNSPEALLRVLQKFLAKDKTINPNFPVPYEIYTLSDNGVEKITDAKTKQPIMINVDNSTATGQGAKDIRVTTTITVNPLVVSTYVERLGSPNPSYLKILVTFPAFFFNGEANATGGPTYWVFGYETQPGHGIPPSILMDFSVDKSAGTVHNYNFDWTGVPASPLGFIMGIFQAFSNSVLPNHPAFSNFVANPMPTGANLTFGSYETPTSSEKCMNWMTNSPFQLGFTYSEATNISGVPVSYDSTVNINQVPQSFSICTTEDRAAHTYTVTYTASSNVNVFQIATDIFLGGPDTVHISLEVDNMPMSIQVVLGDTSMTVTVGSTVGMLTLDATANAGLAANADQLNLHLDISSIPSFSATWGQSSSMNTFSLDTLNPTTSIGSIRFAFASGALVYPAEDTSQPTAHYLFAYSTPAETAIALRLIGVVHIGFTQNNNIGSNTISLGLAGNNLLYVLAHTTVGSMLTPSDNMDLRIVMDSAPTALSLTWVDPFALTLTTNQAISSIISDLTLDNLVAHAEILSLPSDMSWTIAPSGSISFTADQQIGTILVNAKESDGLPGARTFFAGMPVRLLSLTAHGVNSFTASWSSDSTTPMTAFAFNSPDGFGDLTFALSTSLTNFVTVGGSEDNKATLYNDRIFDLGDGLVMEASLWLSVKDITRASASWGGSPTTITAGFGTLAPNTLRLQMQLAGDSSLNPANPKPFSMQVVTSALPTSMDVSVTPQQSFTYTASDKIASIAMTGTVGSGGDITTINGEIDGVPNGAAGQWNAGSFNLQLAPSSTLDRIYLLITNPSGLLGSSYKRFELEVLSVPQNVGATWDLASKSASLSFTDSTFGGGLGSFRVLVSGQDDTSTANYINGLGGSSSTCMTTYSGFTSTIDQRYWTQGQGGSARQTIVNDLQALYCRNPRLDTSADDYAVYLNSASGNILTVRARQINKLAATLDSNVGSAEVDFTGGVALDRPFYFRSEDSGSNNVVLADASKLPDGAAPNKLLFQWNLPGNHLSYDISKVLPFLDVYVGPADATPLTVSFTKLLFVNIPATADLKWDLSSRSSGFFDFVVSSQFEFGFLRQESSGTRYVGYVSMSDLHLTYSIRLPGEGPCSGSYDFCYPVLHVNIDLHSNQGPVNGVFGIYDRRGSLNPLNPSGPAPSNPDYVPLWTFTLANFTYFTLNITWDIGFGISVDWCAEVIPCGITVNTAVFPSVSVGTDASVVVDFWWNDNVSDHTSVLGITFYYNLNTPDYTISSPIHLWPITGLFASGPSINIDLSNVSAGVTFQFYGLHQFSDHVNPGL